MPVWPILLRIYLLSMYFHPRNQEPWQIYKARLGLDRYGECILGIHVHTDNVSVRVSAEGPGTHLPKVHWPI